MDINHKNKIVNISNIDIITNGSLELLATITDPNEIGNIENEEGDIISQITPLFMVINQNHNFKDKLDILVKNGGDLDMEINYYGNKKTARYILETYRNYYFTC